MPTAITMLTFAASGALALHMPLAPGPPRTRPIHMKAKANSWQGRLDKALLDALFCSDVPERNVMKYLQEVERVLHATGVYICFSFGQPEDRLNFLDNDDVRRARFEAILQRALLLGLRKYIVKNFGNSSSSGAVEGEDMEEEEDDEGATAAEAQKTAAAGSGNEEERKVAMVQAALWEHSTTFFCFQPVLL